MGGSGNNVRRRAGVQVMPLPLISCVMPGKRCPFAAPRKPVAPSASPKAARPSAETAVGGVDPQERVKAPKNGFAAPMVVGTDLIQGLGAPVKDGKVLPGGRGQVEFALAMG